MRDIGIAVRKVLTDEQYLRLLEKFWRAMCDIDREEHAALIISRLVYLKEVADVNLIERLRLLGVAASIRGRQLMHAYDELRGLCTEKPGQATYWYVLSALVGLHKNGKNRNLAKTTFKFTNRLCAKNPGDLPCLLSVGNGFYESGSYRCAEAIYLQAYTIRPNEAMISLLLALVYLHMGQARRIRNRGECILKGLTFLQEYRHLRENGCAEVKAEVLYNCARFYHFCNLVHVAAPLYEQVLAIDLRGAKKDISRDAAYNLVRLYSSVGSRANANRVIKSHLQF